jgi:hypothetical protein
VRGLGFRLPDSGATLPGQATPSPGTPVKATPSMRRALAFSSEARALAPAMFQRSASVGQREAVDVSSRLGGGAPGSALNRKGRKQRQEEAEERRDRPARPDEVDEVTAELDGATGGSPAEITPGDVINGTSNDVVSTNSATEQKKFPWGLAAGIGATVLLGVLLLRR